MSEREIRETVRAVMAELDRRAEGLRRGVRRVMIPAAMGTALAMSPGCDSGREVSTGDAGVEMRVPGGDAAYMAPDLQADIGMPDLAYGVPDASADIGPSPDAAYMAPDVMPDLSAAYMGPDALPPEDDLGVQPLYMAADPEANPQAR